MAKWRWTRWLAALAVSVGVSGCDVLSGVDREAVLDSPPPQDCIRQVIQSTPGVDAVRFIDGPSDRNELSIDGIHPVPTTWTFAFNGNSRGPVLGIVQFVLQYDGPVRFANTDWRINSTPPQAEIDATRPVMRGIELKLEADCGVTGLESRVKESCTGGVLCPPLPAQ
jgi:hypothetical protein